MNLAAWVLLGMILLTPCLHAQERVVVGFAVTQKAADDETSVAAEKALRDDLASAVKLLEEKNYSEFFVRYIPIDVFRTLRNHKDYNEIINNAPKQDIDAFIKDIALFKDAKIKFGPNNLTATLSVEVTTKELKPITLKTPPELKDKPPGYGDDLKAAITKAIADLGTPGTDMEKSPNYTRFGKSFLSLSQVAYWEHVGWGRFETSGEQKLVYVGSDVLLTNRVSKIPFADLIALKDLEPKLEEENKRAIFTLPHPKSKFPEPKEARKVIFELVEGNWRLADSAQPMKMAIQEQMKNQPHATSNTKTLPMEKLGTTWRFTPQSFR